jgi:hypothetical protein
MPWSAEMKIRLDTEMRSLLSTIEVDSVLTGILPASEFGGIF